MVPGGYLYPYAIVTIQQAPNDPENTLQVALTLQQLAVLGLSLSLATRLFPEIRSNINELSRKLSELSEAQEFLPSLDEDDKGWPTIPNTPDGG